MARSTAHDLPAESDSRGRAEFEIRPGVIFPDWGAIGSDAAEAALMTIFRAVGVARRWNHYRPAMDHVRTAILQDFARTARGPSLSSLSTATGMALDELLAVLDELHDRDLVVLEAPGHRIAGAYPFTERETGHIVHYDGRALRAMCAVDAMGIGAMMDRDIAIESRCRTCGAPVQVKTGDHGSALKYCSPAEAVVWVGDSYAGNCGATSLCTMIAFFCSDAHLLSWQASSAPDAAGHRLSAREAHQLGCAIFGPMLRGTGGKGQPVVSGGA